MKQRELYVYDSNNLEPVKELGKGSYGEVRLFKDKQFKQYVVGKLITIGGNRKMIKKRLADAKREAKILARLKHKNIVRVFGIVANKDKNFEMILEYAPFGDLESFLLLDSDISLPWKIRLRFFTELANALDYLHYHDPNRPYIHGDLKSQNVLLGNLLTVKLADFGAASIEEVTGATSLTINDNGSSQHTPLYTAPEYLRDPNEKRSRCRSMDVYSYGMTGYEIITRTPIFSGSQVSKKTLISVIIAGQKPDKMCIDEVNKSLVANSCESRIFKTLKKIVYKCWQTGAEDRPKISDVKQRLDELAQKEQIFDNETVIEVENLMKLKKLNITGPSDNHQSRTTIEFEEEVAKRYIKQSSSFIALAMSTILVGLYAFVIIFQLS